MGHVDGWVDGGFYSLWAARVAYETQQPLEQTAIPRTTLGAFVTTCSGSASPTSTCRAPGDSSHSVKEARSPRCSLGHQLRRRSGIPKRLRLTQGTVGGDHFLPVCQEPR